MIGIGNIEAMLPFIATFLLLLEMFTGQSRPNNFPNQVLPDNAGRAVSSSFKDHVSCFTKNFLTIASKNLQQSQKAHSILQNHLDVVLWFQLLLLLCRFFASQAIPRQEQYISH